jgi:hypothetical protein
MHPAIAKTFGGLSRPYYFRHFVFGLMFPVFMYMVLSNVPRPVPMFAIAIMVINTLLYPYSRFVYEGVMGFIMGRNVFSVNAVLMLGVKIMTMMLCWVAAIFIAPIGLAYLYFHHSKAGDGAVDLA